MSAQLEKEHVVLFTSRQTEITGARAVCERPRLRRSPQMRFQPMLSVVVFSGVTPCSRHSDGALCADQTRPQRMFSDRLLSIFELMASRERSGDERGLLCSVATQITGVDGAAIALAADDPALTRLCSSNSVAGNLLDLEITVGEGPCSSSISDDVIVSEPDLTSARASQWLLYTPEAIGKGARAVFGFPVRIGVIRLGALALYSTTPGQLSDAQSSDALLMASVVGRGIVALQAGASPDTLSDELQREANFDFTVHQAAGMVAVQASISIASALIALRMHAYSTSEDLSAVSARVISRQLRFDAQQQEWIEDE